MPWVPACAGTTTAAGDEPFALLQSITMRCNCSTPSVSAAGPGCRMSADLISNSWPFLTAFTLSQPGRAATFSGRNFLPHQEPITMSGLRRTISLPSAMMRSLPIGIAASSAKQSSPPAIRASSETQRIALMCGWSHSSK
jgi:hypothetical protein